MIKIKRIINNKVVEIQLTEDEIEKFDTHSRDFSHELVSTYVI
jgi:hypothetical protein